MPPVELGKIVAGAKAGVARRELARRIAVAQAEIIRARRARQRLHRVALDPGELARRLASIDRHERRDPQLMLDLLLSALDA